MAEKGWTKVASEKELADRRPLVAKVDDREILVVRSGGTLFACANKCSHYGGKLSDGLVVGGEVICPLHNAHFEMATGALASPPGIKGIAAFEVKVDGGDLYVRERGAAERPAAAPAAAEPSAPRGQVDAAKSAARTAAQGTGRREPSLLIIGAGAAADMAAATLREEGFAGRITLVTRERGVPYDRPTLSKDLIAGEAKPEWLPLRDEGFYREHEIEILSERTVATFDPRSKSAGLTDGTTLRAELVILATGGLPRRLAVAGADLGGVHYLRTLADGQAIVEAAGSAKRAVVIGSSFIGLEVASGLRERAIETHVVAPERLPLAAVFGARIAERIRRLHEERGVRFHLETMPVAIEGKGRAERVVLANGEKLETDFVVVGIGVVPATGYLAQSGLLEGDAVPVNEHLETGIPGVYAAGDIAVVPHPITGEPARIEHWVVAQRHGMHIAREILGRGEPYREPPFFWTMQYKSSFKYVGHARGASDLFYRGDPDAGPFAVGYYVKGRLAAVAALQRNRDILVAGELLKAGRSITPEQFVQTEDLDGFLA